jgi:hypothetical protein
LDDAAAGSVRRDHRMHLATQGSTRGSGALLTGNGDRGVNRLEDSAVTLERPRRNGNVS